MTGVEWIRMMKEGCRHDEGMMKKEWYMNEWMNNGWLNDGWMNDTWKNDEWMNEWMNE